MYGMQSGLQGISYRNIVEGECSLFLVYGEASDLGDLDLLHRLTAACFPLSQAYSASAWQTS